MIRLVYIFSLYSILASLAMANPISNYWDQKEVRKALEALPDLSTLERTLHFEVRDGETGEILPEVEYIVRDMHFDVKKEPEPIAATGRYDHILPAGESQYYYYTITAPGYGSQTWRIELDNNYNAIVPIKVQLKQARSVSGRVLNEEGVPIPGVYVYVRGNALLNHPEGQMFYSKEVTTGADGSWMIKDFPAAFEEISLSLAHKDYVSDIYSGSREYSLDVSPEITSTMKKGGPFRGVVVNEAGAPIPGALLKMRIADKVETHSDEQGHFEISHLDEEYFKNFELKISAEGYAAHYLRLDSVNPKESSRIVLTVANPLKVKLFAPDGGVLANNKVFVRLADEDERSLDFFYPTSDENGILIFPEAPPNKRWSFSPYSKGTDFYDSQQNLFLTPRENAHELHFQLGTRIIILPVDEKTNEPLAAFRVTQGSIREVRENRPEVSVWNPGSWWDFVDYNIAPTTYTSWERHSQWPISHLYRTSYYEYEGNPILFRLEADGYYAAQTPPVDKGDGEVLFKVRMKQGKSLHVRVLGPDKLPVEDVVAVWTPKGKNLTMYNGNLQSSQASAPTLSDVEGWLSLPPIQQDMHILVLCSTKGFHILNGVTLNNEDVITLRAWGQLEGQTTPKIAALATGGIRLDSKFTQEGIAFTVLNFTQPDITGRFMAKYLPPGNYSIGACMEPSTRAVQWAKVDVLEGETARVNLQGERTIMGKFDAPERARDWLARLPDAANVEQITEYPDSSRYMSLKVKSDGSFEIELPPGDYQISGHLYDPDDNSSGGRKILYMVENFKFSVASSPDGAPLDVGTIVYKDMNTMNQVQENAPRNNEFWDRVLELW